MARPDLPHDGPDWALLLGPGEDLDRLAPLLEALEDATALGPPIGIESLEDLGELFGELPTHGRLVLHARGLPLEDLGLVRRFLDIAPGWELVLVGDDPGSSVPRRLLRLPATRWIGEPIDVDQLADLLSTPALGAEWAPLDDEDDEASEGHSALEAALEVALDEDELAAFRDDVIPRDEMVPRDEMAPRDEVALRDEMAPHAEPDHETTATTATQDEPPSTEHSPLEDEIERILALPPHEADHSESAGDSTSDISADDARLIEEVLGADDAVFPSADSFGETPSDPFAELQDASAPDSARAAPYFKDQVADLADIALRIELSLEMARERALEAGDDIALQDVEVEVQRLSQFTRTLGYLSSPPATGRMRIELGEMIEEMLAEAGSDEHSPRYLWRSTGPLVVRCDKTLMHHALEAVLYLVHHCAGPAGTVRVEGREADDDDGSPSHVELTLSFPPGQLADLDPAQAVIPYALRTVLPDLGPNALAAAAGILRGQGGELQLAQDGELWVWTLRLPRG